MKKILGLLTVFVFALPASADIIVTFTGTVAGGGMDGTGDTMARIPTAGISSDLKDETVTFVLRYDETAPEAGDGLYDLISATVSITHDGAIGAISPYVGTFTLPGDEIFVDGSGSPDEFQVGQNSVIPWTGRSDIVYDDGGVLITTPGTAANPFESVDFAVSDSAGTALSDDKLPSIAQWGSFNITDSNFKIKWEGGVSIKGAFTSVSAVPEPSSFALLGLVSAGLATVTFVVRRGSKKDK